MPILEKVEDADGHGGEAVVRVVPPFGGAVAAASRWNPCPSCRWRLTGAVARVAGVLGCVPIINDAIKLIAIAL